MKFLMPLLSMMTEGGRVALDMSPLDAKNLPQELYVARYVDHLIFSCRTRALILSCVSCLCAQIRELADGLVFDSHTERIAWVEMARERDGSSAPSVALTAGAADLRSMLSRSEPSSRESKRQRPNGVDSADDNVLDETLRDHIRQNLHATTQLGKVCSMLYGTTSNASDQE